IGIGSLARRPPRSKLSTSSATRLIFICCPWAMPETSLRTGPSIKNIPRWESRRGSQRCLAFKPQALLQFFTIASSNNPKRWHRRFALAIRQVGNKPAPRSPNQMERLILLVTNKFLRPRPGWRDTKEFLSNRQVRPPLPGFLNAAIQKRQHIHFRRSQDKAELFAPSLDMD